MKNSSKFLSIHPLICLSAHLLVCWLLVTDVSAKTLVVANFDNGADPLSIGAGSSIAEDAGNVTHVYVTSAPVLRNRGYALQINHITAGVGWLSLSLGTTIDISTNSLNPYTALSFWVKGATGTEIFAIDLKSQNSAPQEPIGDNRVRIKDFLPAGGITTSWQKVTIPVKALTKGIPFSGLTDISDVVLDFSQDGAWADETIYIDDLIFHSKTAPVYIDTFEGAGSPNALRENLASGHDLIAGTDAFGVIVTTQSYTGSKSYQMNYTVGASSTSGAYHTFNLRDGSTGGKFVNVGPNTNRLSFAMKKEANTVAPSLVIEFWDHADNDKKVITSYAAVTDNWQIYSIPLSDFPNRDLTRIDRIIFTFTTLNSTAIVYIDDLKIVDITSPTVPTSLLKNGIAVANGTIFTSTDVLSVTADAATTDTTLERVRFEHDNLTGGASWYLIGVDTDTSDTTYSTPWQNFNTLIPGTTYQIRVVAEDLSDNEGRMTPFTSIALPLVNSASAFSGAAVSVTSIQWNWKDNTTLEDGYRVYSSTGGQMSPDLNPSTTFWIETNLLPNTQYSRKAAPFKGGVNYSSTLIDIRYTLANPVPSVSLTDSRVNPFATIAWSSGTGGNTQFVIQRATDVLGGPGTYVVRSTVTGITLTYRDSGLDAGTTYWYRVVGYNGDLTATAASPALMVGTDVGPTISHTTLSTILIPSGSSGNDVKIPATVTSNTIIKDVQTLYRKKGDSSFLTAAFVPSLTSSLTLYSGSATIPASFVKDSLAVGGFEYFIIASDSLHISSSPAEGINSVSVSDSITAPTIGSGGGTISVSDGDPSDGETSITIPAGATSENVQVTIKQLNTQTAPALNNASPVVAYEFGPTGLKFDKPVTMTFIYPDKNRDGIVDGTNIDEKTLKFFWHDGFVWRNLGGTVDTNAKTVSASVSHFSTFGLFSGSDPTEQEVWPKEKIITPNGDRINDFAQFGISGSFEISIFDMRGKRIRKLENVNIWDGRKDDGSVAESGVYIYQVKSDRLKVAGTVGVAR